MDEDVYGPLREIGVRRHVNCALCGRLVAAKEAVWVNKKTEDSSPDYQSLCRECASARQEPVLEEEPAAETE